MPKKRKILYIAGTRPNFMKIFPLLLEGKKHSCLSQSWINTQQHYDDGMSKMFIRQFKLPKPVAELNVRSGSHAEQTGKVMQRIDTYLDKIKPDLLVVVGDVNSTLACSLAAVKKNIPIAHVEAGLRSYDWDMPEEINRLLTDQISDYLLTHSKSAENNLKAEGISKDRIHYVGNIMIDTLKLTNRHWKALKYWEKFNLKKKGYILATIHRPSNVDTKQNLTKVIDILQIAQNFLPVIFPIHPRTQKSIKRFGFEKRIKKLKNLKLIKPIGYFETMSLLSQAKAVLTDSGGIQEESSVLKVPCLTMRNNTERPVTIASGTSLLTGLNIELIDKSLKKIMKGNWKKGKSIPYWDGQTRKRIIKLFHKI